MRALRNVVIVTAVCALEACVRTSPHNVTSTPVDQLPRAIASERRMLETSLRYDPKLVQYYKTHAVQHVINEPDGTKLLIFSTRDAIVIKYGPHEYTTVSY